MHTIEKDGKFLATNGSWVGLRPSSIQWMDYLKAAELQTKVGGKVVSAVEILVESVGMIEHAFEDGFPQRPILKNSNDEEL